VIRIAPDSAHRVVAGLLLCGGGLLGCSDPTAVPLTGPQSVEVELVGGATGCELDDQGQPQLLDFGTGWHQVQLSFQVLDANGERDEEYDGKLDLKLLPGKCNPTVVEVKQGAAGPVTIAVQGFGLDARLWAQARDDDGRGVAGVSPRLCFENPRVHDLQVSDVSYRSPLSGRQVLIDRGTLIATGTSTQGFFATDVSACGLRDGYQPPADPADVVDGEALDCTRSYVRQEVTLAGEEWALIPAPGIYPDTQVRVFPQGRDQPFAAREAYKVQVQAGEAIGVARRRDSPIPDGDTVIVEYTTDDDPLLFQSIYVYSYSAPYGVEVGSRFCSILGGVTEFLGLTEIGFPSYRVYLKGGASSAVRERPINEELAPDPRDDDTFIFVECALDNPTWMGRAYLPPPVFLAAGTIPGAEVPVYRDSHMDVDRYESALVRLENITLPTRWLSCDLDGSRMVDRCYDQDWEEGRCLQNQKAENDCEMACATAGATGLRPGQQKADFAGCTELTNFDNYGQFVVTTRNAAGDRSSRINLNTRGSVPEYDPRPASEEHPYGRLYPGMANQRYVKGIRSVVGTLFQVNSARPVWQVVPRGLEDIEFEFVDD